MIDVYSIATDGLFPKNAIALITDGIIYEVQSSRFRMFAPLHVGALAMLERAATSADNIMSTGVAGVTASSVEAKPATGAMSIGIVGVDAQEISGTD